MRPLLLPALVVATLLQTTLLNTVISSADCSPSLNLTQARSRPHRRFGARGLPGVAELYDFGPWASPSTFISNIEIFFFLAFLRFFYLFRIL